MEQDLIINKDKDRLVWLERLVEELICDKPCEDKVRDYMLKTGIPYSADPIERMNKVLMALHEPEQMKGTC